MQAKKKPALGGLFAFVHFNQQFIARTGARLRKQDGTTNLWHWQKRH